jgi:serine/threonine protein kinase
VLIDHGENAVLCDFGLSRIKADINSRTPADASSIVGSRYWMAPERLTGSIPRKPSDVYAFGLMIYEVCTVQDFHLKALCSYIHAPRKIHTNEVPLGHLSFMEVETLVVERNIRPEQPDGDEAPQMTDDTWDLAERCWVKDPHARPNVGAVCNIMKLFLEVSQAAQPKEREQLFQESSIGCSEQEKNPQAGTNGDVWSEIPAVSDPYDAAAQSQIPRSPSISPDPFATARPLTPYRPSRLQDSAATARPSTPHSSSHPTVSAERQQDNNIQ